MDAFRDTPTGITTLMAHPVPWRHVSTYGDGGAAILDAEDKLVVMESQVSQVVYDLVWAAYFDLLRE